MKTIITCLICTLVFLTGCNSSEDVKNVYNIDSERMLNINKYMAQKDFDIMRHFVKRKSWKMNFSEDGYFYEIFNEGEKPLINDNQQVKCNYSISLMDGTQCYDITDKIFVVSGTEEISGLHHAVKRLGKGGHARFMFPSNLAYGLQGDFNKIPPRAILIYNVQITDTSD